jgi:hypothetical protein
MSLALPAPTGTITVMLRVGQSCADAMPGTMALRHALASAMFKVRRSTVIGDPPRFFEFWTMF